MDTIVLADHIGEWLVPTSINSDSWMYKIISDKEFEGHHRVDCTRKPHKVNFGRIYDNISRYYKLVSDEEVQEILRNRKQPSPYDHVIKKIREMKARRERMGYDY